ncbi:MAG: hypothetical protein J3R72DRAFT_145173 [Linnemannia gamsii]|nr:MAG: hypothetical protein J3R72DRAFT_145173 [Linnemannia gamsii]
MSCSGTEQYLITKEKRGPLLHRKHQPGTPIFVYLSIHTRYLFVLVFSFPSLITFLIKAAQQAENNNNNNNRQQDSISLLSPSFLLPPSSTHHHTCPKKKKEKKEGSSSDLSCPRSHINTPEPQVPTTHLGVSLLFSTRVCRIHKQNVNHHPCTRLSKACIPILPKTITFDRKQHQQQEQ